MLQWNNIIILSIIPFPSSTRSFSRFSFQSRPHRHSPGKTCPYTIEEFNKIALSFGFALRKMTVLMIWIGPVFWKSLLWHTPPSPSHIRNLLLLISNLQKHSWPGLLTTLVVAIGCLIAGCDLINGTSDRNPRDLDKQISPEARALIRQAYQDMPAGGFRDYHVHLLGMNEEVNGTYVNPDWQSPWKGLFRYGQFVIFKNAAGITDENRADAQYLERLTDLIRHMPQPGTFGLLAFDFFHDEQGRPNRKLSSFHVPNEYVMDVAIRHPDLFFPIISIHPYRADAVTELQRYAEQGVRFVKWLPNSMGIHPDSVRMRSKLEAFYRTMREYDMVLLSHTGQEVATEAEGYQHLGNPLLLKKPLDMGVKVIMAHVASLSECKVEDADLCAPGTPSIDLAFEMLEDPRYEGLLFADISGLTHFNRMHNLDAVLARTSIHSRLINGSDYPLPAVNIVIQTRALVFSGHITPEERQALNEIYNFNPMLFDFVLKRILRHSQTGQQFPASVFLEHPALPTRWSPQ